MAGMPNRGRRYVVIEGRRYAVGPKPSAEARAKISAAQRGRKKSEGEKAKLRAAWKRRDDMANRHADHFAAVAGFGIVHHGLPIVDRLPRK